MNSQNTTYPWVCGILTPDKVGFPEKKFDTETEDDHPWFELDELDFEDSAEAPQIDKSPEEVVDLFLAAKGHWEE